MSKLHLVTGYMGEEHIQSADQGSFNASFFGSGEFVMEAGNQFEASIMDNNTVRILDGDVLMKGRHLRIEPKTYADVTIETGTAGVNRNDLIVFQYSKDTATGIESSDIVVIKGAEASGTATDPTYTDGDILGGATFNQMPMYRVKVEGVVLAAIEPLFAVIPTYKTLAEQYAQQYADTIHKLKTDNILDTMEEVEANTQEGQIAGALALKEFKNTRNVKTYYSVSQLGLSLDNTIEEVMDALPINSELIQNTSKTNYNFTVSLPNGIEAGEVRFCKGGASQRGIVEFKSYSSNRVYINRFYDNTLQGWRKLAEQSELDTYYSLADAVKIVKQSATVTVPANDLLTTSLTLPVPSGYTLIGLGGVQMGDKSLVPVSFFCSSGNKVSLSISNMVASELTASVVVHGFCCKTHLK